MQKKLAQNLPPYLDVLICTYPLLIIISWYP